MNDYARYLELDKKKEYIIECQIHTSVSRAVVTYSHKFSTPVTAGNGGFVTKLSPTNKAWTVSDTITVSPNNAQTLISNLPETIKKYTEELKSALGLKKTQKIDPLTPLEGVLQGHILKITSEFLPLFPNQKHGTICVDFRCVRRFSDEQQALQNKLFPTQVESGDLT